MYWEKRKNNLYYQKIKQICSDLIKENENYSIIDYGCHDTEVIFDLKCKNKFLLDLNNNYSVTQKQIILEKNIKFIKDSILNIKYQNEFDICLCLQTLEHLDNPKKAFEIIHKSSKNYTIISLPYQWSEFKCHLHHHIDEEVIKEWTQIDPNESFIVQDSKVKRIINVYIKK
jgi:2-polyprenyl-3-methyl-5-hydroxy-6-metoxy-1,4-benzoquinol methylase